MVKGIYSNKGVRITTDFTCESNAVNEDGISFPYPFNFILSSFDLFGIRDVILHSEVNLRIWGHSVVDNRDLCSGMKK